MASSQLAAIGRAHSIPGAWVGILGAPRVLQALTSDVMMGAAIGSFGGWEVVRYMYTDPDNRLNRWLLPRGALPN